MGNSTTAMWWDSRCLCITVNEGQFPNFMIRLWLALVPVTVYIAFTKKIKLYKDLGW